MKWASAMRSPSPSGSAIASTSSAIASPLSRVLRPPCRPEPCRSACSTRVAGSSSRLAISIAWRLSVALSFRRSGELRQAQARRVSRRARSVSSCSAEHHQGVLEQRDQPRVVAGPGPLVASAEAQRGARQLPSIPGASSDVCGLVEGRASRVEVARPRLHVAERQERLGLLWSSAMPPRAITASAIRYSRAASSYASAAVA